MTVEDMKAQDFEWLQRKESQACEMEKFDSQLVAVHMSGARLKGTVRYTHKNEDALSTFVYTYLQIWIN